MVGREEVVAVTAAVVAAVAVAAFRVINFIQKPGNQATKLWNIYIDIRLVVSYLKKDFIQIGHKGHQKRNGWTTSN